MDPVLRHVYGPVRSRRLGLSLGVDIIPMKTCSFNCVYCQLGGGYPATIERKVYVRPDEITEQIAERLASTGSRPDYITLGGSGEPTLNESFGEIAAAIRKKFALPVCLLTNGSLMWDETVRAACRPMDVIIPNLDACDEQTFQAVNRPHPSLEFSRVADGLRKLRAEFRGELWLEIFIVPGLNDSDSHCRAFRKLAALINPDRIYLNTAVRPPAERFVQPAPGQRLQEICRLLGPKARIAAPQSAGKHGDGTLSDAAILDILRRRPCTAADIGEICGTGAKPAAARLRQLAGEGKIRCERENGENYFVAVAPGSEPDGASRS